MAKTLLPLAGTLVGLIGLGIHYLRAGRVPLDVPLWIPTEQETVAMATPIARIAARHVPLDPGQLGGDVGDVLELVAATGAYGVHHRTVEKAIETGFDPATGESTATPPPPVNT